MGEGGKKNSDLQRDKGSRASTTRHAALRATTVSGTQIWALTWILWVGGTKG